MKICVIGTGNVAFSLVPALKNAGHQIENVSSRGVFEIAPETETVIICTADKAVSAVAEKLQQSLTVVHTSGSTDLSVLKKRFEKCGVIYPIQTFTKGRLVDFQNVPLLIEASDDQTFAKLEQLAQTLSPDVRKMTSEQRKILHLAAVFACNFSNHMIAVSEFLTKTNGVDFSLLKPLIKETLEKALQNSPLLCQTGPAQREDKEIMESHLKLLENYAVLKKIYTFASQNIMDFKKLEK